VSAGAALAPLFPNVLVHLDLAEDSLEIIQTVATELTRAGLSDGCDVFLRLAYDTSTDEDLLTLIGCTVTVL
jgi:hypothetical protein